MTQGKFYESKFMKAKRVDSSKQRTITNISSQGMGVRSSLCGAIGFCQRIYQKTCLSPD